ncbi:hypothetical protein D3C71_916240 [compost metagenome]
MWIEDGSLTPAFSCSCVASAGSMWESRSRLAVRCPSLIAWIRKSPIWSMGRARSTIDAFMAARQFRA